MQQRTDRYELASDNTAGIHPDILAALEQANAGPADSYGTDGLTRRVREAVRDLFETDCEAFLVFNGTSANALALAQLCQPFHSVICYQQAHIQTDECGAPEFFTRGSKLLLVPGAYGKIDINAAEEIIAHQPEVHAHKPRVISITQSTELGTVYQREEIAAIADFARTREMSLHMDGARFANAVAALGCSPKEITWQAGVNVLCFGGTKNGAAAAELVIFFDKKLACDFEYRLKQGGQLGSKSRFLAAQWLALLQNDLWLRNARHANAMARKLADRLGTETKIDIVFPIQANAVFVRLSSQTHAKLQSRGWHFYQFVEPDVYRLMCSWATIEKDIDDFVADLLR